jgi:AAA domain
VQALQDGSRFLDRETRRSGVLLLSEERHSTFAEKQARWQLGEDVHLLLSHQIGSHSWDEVVEQATTYCVTNGLTVLVVDTLAAWAQLGGESENAAGAVLEQLRPLMRAAAAGLAVVIVAHQRKSQGEHGEAIRGSNVIVGAVDIILELERPRSQALAEEGLRELVGTSRYAATPQRLALALTETGYESRDDGIAAKADLERDRLLRVLRELDRGTAEEIADVAEITPRAVRGYMEQLHADGKVGRTGRGVKGSPHVFYGDSGIQESALLPESNWAAA